MNRTLVQEYKKDSGYLEVFIGRDRYIKFLTTYQMFIISCL